MRALVIVLSNEDEVIEKEISLAGVVCGKLARGDYLEYSIEVSAED